MFTLLFYLQVPEKILTHLLVAELQQCAQVSRLWRKQVAASISTRRCYAYLGRNCKEIMKFSYFVESLDCCFINSLNIRAPLEHSNSCNSIPTSKQAKAVRDSIMKLRIRSLDVHVGACRATDFLLTQVLVGASSTLEELTLTYLVCPQIFIPELHFSLVRDCISVEASRVCYSRLYGDTIDT